MAGAWVLATPIGSAEIPPPVATGTVWYLTNSINNALFAQFQVNANNGVYASLAAAPPTKTGDDLAEYVATPRAAATLLIGSWFTPPLESDVALEGDLEFAATLACDTAMTDIGFTVYLAKIAAGSTARSRDGTPYRSVGNYGTLASSSALLHETWSRSSPYEVKAGERLGLYVYAGGTGDGVNCFLLMNSVSNPSYIVLPYSNLPPAVESFTITTPVASAEAEAGSVASFEVEVSNAGDAEATYAWEATGLPESFGVSFSEANGTLAPNETRSVTIDVSVPAETDSGPLEFNVTVKGPWGGNASAVLTLEVVAPPEAAPPTSSQVGSGPNSTGAPALTNESASPADASPLSEAEIPGISAPSAVVVVAFAGVLAGRRNRIR